MQKNDNMIHYIYKIIFLKGEPENRYYIGKRSTGEYDNWKEDPYAGSGVFCDNYFSEYGKILDVTYKKECLEETDSFETNRDREKYWIGDLWKLGPLCMNRQPGGNGAPFMDMYCGKPVNQYDLNGTFIKNYKTQLEAFRETGINNSSISSCCFRKTSRAGNYIWRFENDCVTEEDINNIYFHEIPVEQYDRSKNLIATYDSISDASKATGIEAGSISDICINRTKNRHTAGGYFWCKKGETPKFKMCKNFIGPRKVIQKSIDGKVIKEYSSLAEAGKAVNTPWQAIQRVCNGKRKSTHGFKWEWGN